jgi:hypothetical protein
MSYLKCILIYQLPTSPNVDKEETESNHTFQLLEYQLLSAHPNPETIALSKQFYKQFSETQVAQPSFDHQVKEYI